MVQNEYETHKCDIIAAFTGSIPEDATKELVGKYNKLSSYLESSLYGNPYVNMYTLVKAYQDKHINPFKQEIFCEDNSDEIDELNVSGTLFPRFGFENVYIDDSKITKNEYGLPVLSAKDKANLKVIGVNKEIVDSIINSSNETVVAANETLKTCNSFIEENKEALFDAKCS